MSASETSHGVRGRLVKRSRLPLELIIAIAIATGLRMYQLGAESIWLDEAVSITMTEESWWYLLFEFPGQDPHPPLHYLLLKAWVTIAGNSEFSVRLLSALFAIATVPLLYYLGRLMFDRFTGAAAAIFFAVAPFQIWYAQEARMYSLFVMLTVASFLSLVLLSDNFTRNRAALYIIVTSLMVYSHVYALFIVFTQAVFIGWRWLRLHDAGNEPLSLTLQQALQVFVGVGIVSAPWLMIFFSRLGESTDRVSWIETPGTDVFTQIFTLFSFGYTAEGMYHLSAPPLAFLAVAALCILLAIGWVWLGRSIQFTEKWGLSMASFTREQAALQLLLLWLTLPIALSYVLSHLITPFLIFRPMTAMAPAFLLLLAIGARVLASLSIPYRSLVPYVVIIILLSGMLIPLPSFYADDYKDQWRDAGAFVDDTAEPGDVVLISHPYNDYPFLYYFDDDDVAVVGVWPDDSSEAFDQHLDDASQVYVVLGNIWGEEREQLLQTVDQAIGDHTGADHRDYGAVHVYRYQPV